MKFAMDVQRKSQMLLLTFERSWSNVKIKTVVLKNKICHLQ